METLIKILSAFVPVKRLRTQARIWLRNFIYGRRPRKVAHVGEGVNFGGPVKLTGQTTIGPHSAFRGGFEVSGSGACTIGRYCHFGPNCTILTQNHNYDDGETIPYGRTNTLKPVVIEDFVWCGRSVIILPGAHVGEGAILQAGAIVHGAIPPLAIAGGNPAKVFASRDRGHFDDCKQRGAFY